jgi:hypothetical protein
MTANYKTYPAGPNAHPSGLPVRATSPTLMSVFLFAFSSQRTCKKERSSLDTLGRTESHAND